MIISEFEHEDLGLRDQLAWSFKISRLVQLDEYGKDSVEKVKQLMASECIAVSAIEAGKLIGFVGAIPF